MIVKISFRFSLAFFFFVGAAICSHATNIRLDEIDGRTWLIDSTGQPFFAHGITHVGTVELGAPYEKISEACKEVGFNAYGYGCPDALKDDMPYFAGVNHIVPMSMYRGDGSFRYVDIFDPQVQQKLDEQIKYLCLQNRDNPNLIGYFWTDLAVWRLENNMGTNWVEFIRELPEDSPGQKAYQAFLEGWEGDDPKVRDQAFLRRIAAEYFRVLGEANRKYDPDHLIFGDRFAPFTIDFEVLEEMLPYVDAIGIQPHFNPGFPKAEFDRVHEVSGKPILICDFAIRFEDDDKEIRGYKPLGNPAAAGEAYVAYLREAMATPYIIGAFWCNPVDSTPGFQKAGVKQGFFDEGVVPRPGLSEAIREFNTYRDSITPEG
ncbi:MAG: beta-agarase [Verrucomicrobiota bacterium]